jgi:F-box domain
MTPKSQLLDLPNELIEHILSLLCLENAGDIHACRLTCRALNVMITESALVQYLMHTALLGVYDPLVADPAAPTLPERMAELHAWEDAWRAVGDALHRPDPDVRISPPDVEIDVDLDAIDPPVSLTTRRFRHRYSFSPWFIVAAREGPHVRAGYSYLDVPECLRLSIAAGAVAASAQSCDDEYQCWNWTTVEVSVRRVLVFAMSPELDLAVAISCAVYGPLSWFLG